jgi:hypothetical protein
VALAVPRQAFLGMVALNYQGIATRYNLKTAQGKKEIEDKWEKLGGEPGSFRGSVSSGEKKKPQAIETSVQVKVWNVKNDITTADFVVCILYICQ